MDALHGLMDGVHVHIHAMKEPDYTNPDADDNLCDIGGNW